RGGSSGRPTSTARTGAAAKARATITARMAEGVKPYRLYRGGRSKGKVPLDGRSRPDRTPPSATKPPRRRRWGLWIALGVVGLVVLLVAWGALGYVSFSHGVAKANDRLPPGTRAKLAPQDGSLLSNPSTIL